MIKTKNCTIPWHIVIEKDFRQDQKKLYFATLRHLRLQRIVAACTATTTATTATTWYEIILSAIFVSSMLEGLEQ
jgi:hypothetical protein